MIRLGIVTGLAAEARCLRAGSLEVRLAHGQADVDASQALRYRVFYDEMDALPAAAMAARRRDFDDFDDICDHLIPHCPDGLVI